MRIGLLSPSIYMSPTSYSNMIFAPRDLVVALADGLTDHGHEVHFFTAPDIKTKAFLIGGDQDLLQKEFIEEKLKGKPDERLKWGSFYAVKKYYEMDLTEKCYKMAIDGKLDIVHSYHDSLAHFSNEMTQFPTVYTLHDPLPTNENNLSYWLLNKFKHHNYISISNVFRKNKNLHLNFIDTVYHGINIAKYKNILTNKSYMAFIGRMVPEKGIDSAIKAAKITKNPIKIATSSMSENKNIPYYRDFVEPLLNNSLVSLIGFMEGEEKIKFLANASCLLFPIKWEEPFGMVMIEAMACGTPVIAYNRGSVPEIVRDGVTGFVIDPDDEDRPGKGSWIIKKKGVEGLVEAVKRIGEIDRKNCRKHVEENFSVEKMVEGYEKVYQKVIASQSNMS
ncbi:MAG: glycosyltransferase family 4 protein [Candidatus Levybacteria bacterium]|nr:glycosyltransferase family 4 protein [Candidatus Levybacteria bacterium]